MAPASLLYLMDELIGGVRVTQDIDVDVDVDIVDVDDINNR